MYAQQVKPRRVIAIIKNKNIKFYFNTRTLDDNYFMKLFEQEYPDHDVFLVDYQDSKLKVIENRNRNSNNNNNNNNNNLRMFMSLAAVFYLLKNRR